MHQFHSFHVDALDAFTEKLLQLSSQVEYFCSLDSNNYPNYPYSNFGSFIAIDAIDTISCTKHDKQALDKLEKFRQKNKTWLFGFLSYDLKNDIEESLSSNNFDGIDNPILHFFVPKFIVKIDNGKVELGVTQTSDIEKFKQFINQQISTNFSKEQSINILHRIQKQDYIKKVKDIQHQIQIGNIYEMNLCQEFYAENSNIEPTLTFKRLNQISQAPFSCFFKHQHNYLLCASPERFLKKQNQTLISQPIKGTRKRSKNLQEDQKIKQDLFFNEKERSENVMIVDLVRNDFSKIAVRNSVEVEELFGLYSFEQVHQLISTISCKIDKRQTFKTIIEAMFPMGSMTGAPKLSALQLIEQFENTQRGLYSGAVGYITPKGNFDFNVVIRSILYNEKNKYISIQTGSAITIDADAEQEYAECFVKAKAMFEALNNV